MSSTNDGETSTIEWVLLVILLLVGVSFFIKPALVSTGALVDFVDAFPDPAQLGPYGSLLALVSMLLGGGGLIRKKI